MLTALAAVAVGATVFSGMLHLHLDIPRQLEREFRSYGANLLLIPSGKSGVMDRRMLEDAVALLPPDKLVGVTPYRYEPLSLNRQPVTVAGLPFESARKTSPYWRLEGDWPSRPGEIVVGVDVAEFLGLAPGGRVDISGRNRRRRRFSLEATVTGVMRSGGAEDRMAFMDLPELDELAGAAGELSLAEASLAASEPELREIAEVIGKRIEGVAGRPVRRLAGSETAVLGKLSYLTLLVTATTVWLILICVAASMMTAMMERRREIALKKALGADDSSLILEFLGESAIIGFLGGAAGSFAGFFFARFISAGVFNRPVESDVRVFSFAVMAAVSVAVVGAAAPVRRAAAVEPAQALRGE